MREDVIELIRWLIKDVDLGIKLLKINTAMFLEQDLIDLYKTIVEFKAKNEIVNYQQLARLYQEGKFNWDLFVECKYYEDLELRKYKESEVKPWIDFYQKKILDNYKEKTLKKLYIAYGKNKIDTSEYAKKIETINEYHLPSEEDFKTIHEIDLTDEEKTYIKSNVRLLDSSIRGFALGELSVWSGGNASAKSTFLNQMALESINQNFNVAIYSGELTSKRLMQWLFLQAAGKDNIVDIGGFYKTNDTAKSKISYWLDGKIYVFDNEKGNKKDLILHSIRDVVNKKNVKVVIIDNLMSIDLDTNNKYDEQSNFIKQLSNIAKELNIHIHFVCHPRKTTLFLRKNDISGTADLTNIADNVFIIHRVGFDFKRGFKEAYGYKTDDVELFNYSNVIEICKNREFGVQDKFVGLYFERETKRLLNSKEEYKHYAWENKR